MKYKKTPELTEYEDWVVNETRKTGNLNLFTNYFMRLANSGSLWLPGDAIGHYRHLFNYEMLFDAWRLMGKPEQSFTVAGETMQYQLRVLWEGETPRFLLPHGYLMLDWALPMVHRETNLGLAITGTGTSKCLPGSALVYLNDGTRKKVVEVKVGDVLVGVDWKYKNAEQSVVGVFANGKKPLVRITTALGARLECTPNHPLLKVGRWVNAADLQIGDRVALPRGLPVSQSTQTLSRSEAKILGYLIGDGGLTHGSAKFTNIDPVVLADFHGSVEEMGYSARKINQVDRAFTYQVIDPHKDGRESRFLQWLRALGLFGCGSHDKFVPEIVFSQPNEIIALFLSRLFACDGHASVNSNNGQGCIGYCTVSRQLAEDVRILLLRFGILARINAKDAKLNGKIFPAFGVVVCGKTNISIFNSEIGIYSKEEAVAKVMLSFREVHGRESGSDDVIAVEEVRQYILRRGMERKTPGYLTDRTKFRIRHKNITRWKIGEYAEWLDDAFLRDLSDSDVYWDRVVSIEHLPEVETYDLEVEPDHNFIVDGIITHNTSSVAVAALAYCALYPGFHFLNVAPTEDQAALITIELEKWISDTPYATKFIQLTRSGELYKTKPRPTALIRSPFNPRYLSRFVCQTVGRDANSILGSNQDWINIDEVQLMTGIDAALPKLMTRSRAQRADGLPRWSKLTMLTNPGPGVELTEIRKKIVAIQNDKESIIKAVYIDGIDSKSNPYNTKLQAAFHRSLMDASDISRWLDGDMTSLDFTRSLPETLFERCRDQELEDAITKDGKYQPVKREGIGLLHYAVPPDPDKFYMVVGDPGQGNLTKMNQNNIPVVMVLDITDFLVKPSQLVMLTIPDGMGHYDAWLECFKEAMSTYHAKGYYDDTNTQGAFEASGAFQKGYWNQTTKEVDQHNYETMPISFANLNKRWARTIFVTLAGDGMFRWPYLHRLWHEAGKYKEYGEGSKDQADDMLASLFIYCLALRAEGGLWEKYAKRYYVDYDEKRKKLIERQMLAQNNVQAVANRAVARANGPRFRGVRQR